jgi:hypothetical protein
MEKDFEDVRNWLIDNATDKELEHLVIIVLAEIRARREMDDDVT